MNQAQGAGGSCPPDLRGLAPADVFLRPPRFLLAKSLVTGYMLSRGPDGDGACPGDHLGIGGTHGGQGKLLFFNGNRSSEALEGCTTIPLRTWNHVVLVRDGRRVTVYLNGRLTPEIASEADVTRPADARQVFVGGRCDDFANWEGRVTEVDDLNVEAHLELGMAYRDLSQVPAARRHLQRVIDLAPGTDASARAQAALARLQG